MNEKTLMKLSVLFLIVSVFPFMQNNFPKSNKIKAPDKIALIDHLKAKNVITSPFKDIIKKFIPVEENLSKKLSYFRELSTRKEKVWAATTNYSILSYKNKKPQKMEILMNDKKVDFMNGVDEKSINWNWIKTDKQIDIRNEKYYSRRVRCLVLDKDNSFSFKAIFPNSVSEIEISANRNRHPLDLEIYIDDKPVERKVINNTLEHFRVSKKFALGTHKITLRPIPTKSPKNKIQPRSPKVFIYYINIKAQNDIIIFFIPSAKEKNFLKSKITARYLSYKDKNGKENPYLDLYKIKHDFTLNEPDKNDNPENIIKKIVIEDISLNVLMAPPKSEFEFKVYIPPKCFLEFGIGIFSYEKIKSPQSVKLNIIVKRNNVHETIYEKNFQINPGSLKDQIIFEKIDLTRFANKNVKLIFLTKKAKNTATESNVLSFWYNPIIYRPSLQKPKVILISIDTLRANHLGCYGYDRSTSPNIDNFVKDSVLFKNVYAQSSWTLPSHLSMLFSLNSASHQVYFKNQKIDNSFPSLASFLRDNGFVTYAFTGGGYVSSVFGFSKGFDWYGEPIGGPYAFLVKNEAEKLFEYTADWLKKNKDKSFFLFLHTFQTHGPYFCPPPWNEAFLNNKAKWKKIHCRMFLESKGRDYKFNCDEINNIISLYDGEIKYTDEMLIRPLITLLKELKIYDNTILVITSDHGEEFNDHGGWEHGRTLYDELIRVPLIIKFPHSAFKGKKVEAKSRLIDIMPTLLEATSTKYEKHKLDGKSLMELISGKEKKDRTFISDLAYKNVDDPCPALVATNRSDLKFIINKSKNGIKKIEIFNLQKDPIEKNNIFRNERKLAKKVTKNLDLYYKKKQKIKRQKETVVLDEKLKERLRALGYIK